MNYKASQEAKIQKEQKLQTKHHEIQIKDSFIVIVNNINHGKHDCCWSNLDECMSAEFYEWISKVPVN